MKQIATLENWHTERTGDQYTAPELSHLTIVGNVKGHKSLPDGVLIQTSAIIDADGRNIRTENSKYYLGVPSQKWLDWMKDNGIEFDIENPIKKMK